MYRIFYDILTTETMFILWPIILKLYGGNFSLFIVGLPDRANQNLLSQLSRGLPFSGGSLSDLPRIRVKHFSKCCFYIEYAYLILTIWTYPLITSSFFDRKDEQKRFSQLENPFVRWVFEVFYYY